METTSRLVKHIMHVDLPAAVPPSTRDSVAFLRHSRLRHSRTGACFEHRSKSCTRSTNLIVSFSPSTPVRLVSLLLLYYFTNLLPGGPAATPRPRRRRRCHRPADLQPASSHPSGWRHVHANHYGPMVCTERAPPAACSVVRASSREDASVPNALILHLAADHRERTTLLKCIVSPLADPRRRRSRSEEGSPSR